MKKLIYWVPSILIAVTIFLLSSRQRIAVSDEYIYNFMFFKSLHIIEYGVFCFVNYRAVYNTITKDKKKAGIISFIITFAYALTDEFHQTLVPTREGRLRDIGFDTIGALLSVLFIWKLLPKVQTKHMHWVKKLEVM